jgi:hypothetical protein
MLIGLLSTLEVGDQQFEGLRPVEQAIYDERGRSARPMTSARGQ